jgi:hypothetical protein
LLAGATSAATATSPVRSVQTPVFTGRAELTVLNVVVTDRSGRYVGGLPREAPPQRGPVVRHIQVIARAPGGRLTADPP